MNYAQFLNRLPPSHAVAGIGAALPPDYFCPGHSEHHFSKWAIAYWKGTQFRFERTALTGPWVRVA